MAKKIVTIQLDIEIDEEAIGKPVHIWAYQFFNRLGYEYVVKAVKYMSEPKKVIATMQDLVDLPLKAHDSMKPFDRKVHNESLKK